MCCCLVVGLCCEFFFFFFCVAQQRRGGGKQRKGGRNKKDDDAATRARTQSPQQAEILHAGGADRKVQAQRRQPHPSPGLWSAKTFQQNKTKQQQQQRQTPTHQTLLLSPFSSCCVCSQQAPPGRQPRQDVPGSVPRLFHRPQQHPRRQRRALGLFLRLVQLRDQRCVSTTFLFVLPFPSLSHTLTHTHEKKKKKKKGTSTASGSVSGPTSRTAPSSPRRGNHSITSMMVQPSLDITSQWVCCILSPSLFSPSSSSSSLLFCCFFDPRSSVAHLPAL